MFNNLASNERLFKPATPILNLFASLSYLSKFIYDDQCQIPELGYSFLYNIDGRPPADPIRYLKPF